MTNDRTEGGAEALRPVLAQGSLVRHIRHGKGRIVGVKAGFYIVHCKGELHQVPVQSPDLTPEEPAEQYPELEMMKRAVREVLGDYGWTETEFELSKRWIGGTMRLTAGKEGVQPKEIPLEAFFKKVIGVREKLRVLEQKINNHPKLDAADKLELEGYITRCYGSLTTFNVLFAEKPSQFEGASTE